MDDKKRHPILAGVAILACLILLLPLSMAPLVIAFAQQEDTGGLANVPSEYAADVAAAGSICAQVTAPVIAAQIEAESNWDPAAVSPAGAQGIAQFMPATWASVGQDGDGDGRADILNPHDAIRTQGVYMCALVGQVQHLAGQGIVDEGDGILRLALAAYNAGLGNIEQHGGIPPFPETQAYVARIIDRASYYTATTGAVAGELTPALTVSTAGIVSTTGIDLSAGDTYARGQCTWWAAIRRAQIGRPVDPYMGNGGDWADTARRLGYSVGQTPRAGDAISFGRGVLGADATYGHVAIVEAVRTDGSILISEANVLGVGVVSTRTITASQLAAAGTGVQFIH